MKHLRTLIGAIATLYMAAILAFPCMIVWAQHLVADHTDNIQRAFIGYWNAQPENELGKIVSSKTVLIHPWINLTSIGAIIRVDVVMEHWKGFIDIDATKYDGKWHINDVYRVEI